MPVVLSDQLVNTTDELCALYRARVETFGYTAETMFYRTQRQHDKKLAAFAELMTSYPAIERKQVLDIGCGFGRLLDFVSIDPRMYIGLDAFEPFVTRARLLHTGFEFKVSDAAVSAIPSADIAVLAGVLSGVPDSYALLKAALDAAREAILFDVTATDRLPSDFRGLSRLSKAEVSEFVVEHNFEVDECLDQGASWLLIKASRKASVSSGWVNGY